MNPSDWIAVVVSVLVVTAGASFIYWKVRQRKKASPFARRRKKRAGTAASSFGAGDHTQYRPFREGDGAGGFARQPPPFDVWQRARAQQAQYGFAQPPHGMAERYPLEEITRRTAAWRFRPVAPVYWRNPMGQWELSAQEISDAITRREFDVIRQYKKVLTAYCEDSREDEDKRAVDQKIQDVYFSQTGLDMISEAVCDLIDGELQHGLSAQRLRVRLYNTYLLAARKTLDTLTMRLMMNPAVRMHPSYQELTMTARQMKSEHGSDAPGNDTPPDFGYTANRYEPQPQQEPYGDSAFDAEMEERRQCGRLREALGLQHAIVFGDGRQMLCAHEDNMEIIRRAVDKMEAREKPEGYEIKYLELLIALRKAYCSDFVLAFDQTIDTMPMDVCEQQLKNLRAALQDIRSAYTQYPTM